MKYSTGLLLVLLSSSTFAAPPEGKSQAADASASINPAARGAYTLVDSRTASSSSTEVSRDALVKKQPAAPQAAAVAGRYSVQDSGAYLSSAELVQADQQCVFNQASYTYSCR